MQPNARTVVSGIEIIRIQPYGYSLEDISRYRDQVLKTIVDLKGEWVYWEPGAFRYPPLNFFNPDKPNKQIEHQLKHLNCIYEYNLPRYWRKEWLRARLEDWKGHLPAARFLPLDIAPSNAHSYFLPSTLNGQDTKTSGYCKYSNHLFTGFSGVHEQEREHISIVLSRTQNEEETVKIDTCCTHPTNAYSNPKVSILMSIYNMRDTVGWSIRSVLAQTFQEWELWIGDDASNDDSFIEMMSIPDMRIKILKQPHNTGKAQTMNKLLEHAKGKFILELDGDDWLPPTALENLVDILERSPAAGMATGSYGCWFRSRQLGCRWNGVVQRNDIEGINSQHLVHPPVPRMYSKAALQDLGGWINQSDDWNRLFEDMELTSRLQKRYPIISSPEVLYHRVIHQGSMSQRHGAWFASWNQYNQHRR
ncbi:glycosyltransferase family 2 protein [Paenibacillus sp. EC2-1]|uniref:glycosyltransferase family 2 protein n=1 Tax=Paenibacillus sp. EC2-1 TaxID=3388665 RepID=UPI003BEEF93A